MNKISKGDFMKTAKKAGGYAVDLCKTCSLKKYKDPGICDPCPSAYTWTPNYGISYFNKGFWPQPERGNA